MKNDVVARAVRSLALLILAFGLLGVFASGIVEINQQRQAGEAVELADWFGGLVQSIGTEAIGGALILLVVERNLTLLTGKLDQSQERRRMFGRLSSLRPGAALEALEDLDLDGAFQDGGMSNISIRDAQLSGAEVRNAIITDSEITETDFSFSIFASTHFAGSIVTRSSFKGSAFIECDFSKCVIRDSNFEEARLLECNFEGADLRGCNFKNSEGFWEFVQIPNSGSSRFNEYTILPNGERFDPHRADKQLAKFVFEDHPDFFMVDDAVSKMDLGKEFAHLGEIWETAITRPAIVHGK